MERQQPTRFSASVFDTFELPPDQNVIQNARDEMQQIRQENQTLLEESLRLKEEKQNLREELENAKRQMENITNEASKYAIKFGINMKSKILAQANRILILKKKIDSGKDISKFEIQKLRTENQKLQYEATRLQEKSKDQSLLINEQNVQPRNPSDLSMISLPNPVSPDRVYAIDISPDRVHAVAIEPEQKQPQRTQTPPPPDSSSPLRPKKIHFSPSKDDMSPESRKQYRRSKKHVSRLKQEFQEKLDLQDIKTRTIAEDEEDDDDPMQNLLNFSAGLNESLSPILPSTQQPRNLSNEPLIPRELMTGADLSRPAFKSNVTFDDENEDDDSKQEQLQTKGDSQSQQEQKSNARDSQSQQVANLTGVSSLDASGLSMVTEMFSENEIADQLATGWLTGEATPDKTHQLSLGLLCLTQLAVFC